MDIPPPSVPDSRLDDWRQTEQTVDLPFSTPFVSVVTHTCVYEEASQRQQIHDRTRFDHAWRFFFASRIRLDPPQSPSRMLTSIIRPQVAAAFVGRLSDRGFDSIRETATQQVTVGGANGVRKRYRARCRLTVEPSTTDETSDDPTVDGPLSVSLPVEGYLTVWVDDDYYVAGGAYPSGAPDSGPQNLVAALSELIDPTAAREELLALIDGCGET